ncbi:MAG: class I SAM-dependent methyltransferase [Bacteroidota bacterium]
MSASLPEVPHSRENAVKFFLKYIEEHRTALQNKTVADLSAGSGFIINEFHKAGAQVLLFDLFPEQNKFCEIPCSRVDLQKTLPMPNNSVDYAICAETIEHLPNQHFFFQEVARILKPNGILLLTTPNSSSLRSRFSQFLMESEHYSQPAPNEWNAFTRWPESKEGYFSRLFISGILRLRTLAALQSLSIQKIHRTGASSTSALLMIFYPLIYFFSRKNLKKQMKENPAHAATYREIFSINTSVSVLLSKHLIIEFQKKR